jgi:hypothetical protein
MDDTGSSASLSSRSNRLLRVFAWVWILQELNLDANRIGGYLTEIDHRWLDTFEVERSRTQKEITA